MTRNIGVFPSAAKESRLSQILEEDVPEKYRLSPKACRGILNRAARRGKELPEELKTALEAQANPMGGGVQVTPTACKETALTEQTTPDATEKGGERTKATPLTRLTDRQFANAETLGTANLNGYTAEMELGTDFQATNPAGRAVTESLPETSDGNSGGAFHHRLIPSAKESMSAANAYGLTAKGNAIGIDHVLISGGTTFQGRGWYDNVSGCLKTQAHGVMTDEKNDDSE